MTTTEFKTALKGLKNNLRGITLQLVTPNSVRPFNTLREFGNAILNAESSNNSFVVTQVWSSEGVISVTNLKDLAQMFTRTTITGIQFKATYRHESFEDSLRYEFGSND